MPGLFSVQPFQGRLCPTTRTASGFVPPFNTSRFSPSGKPAHPQPSRKTRRSNEECVPARLRYQARLAERQYNQADPDNRLVATELERRWEAALRELKGAEEKLQHLQQ